ncbi:MAG: hypothetical protein DMF49_08415 [Acidobacteria bacterium]|nr:MAG: hypothetical protein DMF49_08415 [Acidobacteriota bacterium]
MGDRTNLGEKRRTWNYRFGQYLKQLREERRLRLDQVEELSIPYQQRISPSYLSRCENGIADISLERLSILSKIYRTDIGLLVDRREQERELASVVPVDVTDVTFEELRRRGMEFVERGELKAAFGYFRAAEERAALETGDARSENVAKARLSMAITLVRMARNKLAKEEAESALALMPTGSEDRHRTILVIAMCHLYLGNVNMASILLESLENKTSGMSAKDRADFLLLRGNVQFSRKQYREAVKSYREASALYKEARGRTGQSRTLLNAANAYGKLRDYDRGIRQALRALELARSLDDKQEIARDLQAIGTLQYRSGDHRAARATLYDCIEIARKGDYHDFLFAAYFYLWRIELAEGGKAAPSIERALRSLLPKLDEELEEAEEFRKSIGERRDE